jgi:uncharacterized membrane protein/protein-disulfide isomerase
MSALARRLVLVFAVLGLAASATSLYVHYQLLHRPGYISFCDVSSTFNCTSAYLSRYGSVAGVPVALLGALWFLFVVIVAAGAAERGAPWSENAAAYVFALSTVALAAILYLAYAAFFILQTICVLCLITYAAVIGVFLISGIATTTPMTTLPRRAVRDLQSLVRRPVALLVVVLFLAGAASAVAFFPRGAAAAGSLAGNLQAAPQVQQDQRAEFQRWFESLPRITVPVPSGGAAVLVVKFSDYQCPSCAQAYFSERSVFAKYESLYPGSVRLVTKNYPLQTECNPSVPRDVHVASCAAAAAVVMARSHGRAEALEDWFYTNQAMMSPATVREAARTVGQVPDFDSQYARAMEEVKTDAGLGRLLGVTATPTFFINGVKVPSALPAQYLDMALALELKRAGVIK